MLGLVLRIAAVEAEGTDSELARAIAGSRDATAAEALLVRRFAPRIRLYGLRHLRDKTSVDDLVQHVLILVLEALREGRVENPERLSAFVLGTCRNVTWDAHRAAVRQRSLERAFEGLVPVEASEPVVPPKRLFDCIARLPEREASVLRMIILEDRSADEVGARLGVSPGNVRVIKHRALAQLGRCVGVEEP